MSPPLREHPLARGKVAERANRLLSRAWQAGWLPEPSLDPDVLWAQAARRFDKGAEREGRSDDDVADFRERLVRLACSVQEEAQLNALGRAMAWGQLTRAVKVRHALGTLWASRPQLLDTTLAPPIIVIGHMRSGTTRIHKLLAADPANAHTRYRDAFHPVGRLGKMKSRVELALLSTLNPWLQTIHPMAPDAVEEELAWLSAALHHSIYETQWHIPAYSAWSEARDPAPVYREFKRILTTDAALRGNADKPRVLKVPAFCEDLDTLLASFPDARLVVAARETAAVHRSAVSLSANQMAVQSDRCDLGQIERLWHHKIALREARMADALARWSGPVTRLDFAALGDDWEREIARAYRELGLVLNSEALGAMRSMMAKAERGAHRAHSAQLNRFAEGS